MKRIADLMPLDRFYFPDDKSGLFTLLSYKTNRHSGMITGCKCMKDGKIHPIYFSAYKEVIQINIKPQSNEL